MNGSYTTCPSVTGPYHSACPSVLSPVSGLPSLSRLAHSHHMNLACLLIPSPTGGSDGKESACSVGDLSSIPGLGRSPGEGNSYPLQYAGLENSMDCTIHGVTKSQARLSDFDFTLPHSRYSNLSELIMLFHEVHIYVYKNIKLYTLNIQF